jgi:cell division protein FtsI (penicillin-binding protein 3)
MLLKKEPGGKTGTSQRLVGNSYSAGQHNASFVGFFPADNPKIVCLVVVHSPTASQYGGSVSAPIFHDVAKRIIEADLNLVPEKKNIYRKQNLIEKLMTDLKSDTKPKTNTYMDLSKQTTTGSKQRIPVAGNKSQMPDLMNQPMRDAVARLNDLGITCKVNGTGRVVYQSIEPGGKISSDVVCFIKCERSSKKIKVSVN